MRVACWVVASSAWLALAAAPAGAQPAPEAESSGAAETQQSRGAVERVLSGADEPASPSFLFWQSEEHGAFIKPVIQMASLLVLYVPHSEVNPDLANRVSTLLLSRFGLEGQLFEYVTFRSVFERNLGFSLSRNGPVGTSVWEGTASLQARESFIRVARWGLALTGGIFPDPASLDYVSTNVLDAFGMDPYMRDPLLVSGFNQGQGVMLSYTWRWLTAGFSYTGGNPLTSSLAFGFGGDVSSLGTLFTAPLRALSNGVPGSEIHMNVMSPSLTFEHDVFDIKTAAQIYFVDVDVTSEDDQELFGYNLRATAQVKLFDEMIRIFASGAYRRNEQLAIPDITTRGNDFEGLLFGGGADFSYGPFGIGGNYYWLESRLSSTNELENQYLNLGVTYWLFEPNVSVGARYARSMASSTTTEPRLEATDSFILSLRLLI